MPHQLFDLSNDRLRYRLCADPEQDRFHAAAAKTGVWSLGYSVLLRLAEHGRLVIDLGANIGTFAVPAAIAGFDVLAYEPDPANLFFLHRAVAENRLTNLLTRGAAAWDRQETLSFDPKSAWGQVRRDGPIQVEAVAVGDEIALPDRVGAIKIDVEGSEEWALAGLAKVLRLSRPAIVFEINPSSMIRTNGTVGAVFARLDGYGYRTYRIVDQLGVLAPAGPLDQEVLVADFLATRLAPAELQARIGYPVRPLSPAELLQQIQVDVRHGRHHEIFAALVAHRFPDLPPHPELSARLAAALDQSRDDPEYLGLVRTLGLAPGSAGR